MFSVIAQSGMSTGIVEIRDLSMLLVGLVGLLWFLAGMLAWSAVREWSAHRVSVASEPMGIGKEPEVEPIDYREAA